MEQSLTRGQAAAIRGREALASLAFLQIVAAVVLMVTLGVFGVCADHQSPRGAMAVLEQAYHQSIAHGTTPTSFPSKAAVVARLKEGGKASVLDESPTTAYRDLKHQGGHDGTVYVRAVSPTRLALVARVQHGAIEELDVSLPQPGTDDSSFRTLYHGHMHWSAYWWVAGLEWLILSLIGIFGGAVWDANLIIEPRRRWTAIVNDSRLGPALPEKGFQLLLPVCEDDGDDVLFQIKELTWRQRQDEQFFWDEELLAHWRYPNGLKPERLARAQGVAEVSARWFDFCSQVADANASRWQAEHEKREQKAEAERQAELAASREAEERAALEKAAAEKLLAPVLAPATDLMRHALDARPLAAEPAELKPGS